MGHEQHNLKNNIKKSKKITENVKLNQQSNKELISENHSLKDDKREFEEKSKIKQNDKSFRMFGIICIAVTIISFIFMNSPNIDTSQSAKNALEGKVSTAISAGTVLLFRDEFVQARDYTITHKSDVEDTKIRVWDYASEDGDYVQVLVDGVALGDAFMIKHKPKEITVPSVGKIQIKGIRDGGGGITYAVIYEINGTSYFNGTPEGEFNTYTLSKE